jgi:hypothetical protein
MHACVYVGAGGTNYLYHFKMCCEAMSPRYNTETLNYSCFFYHLGFFDMCTISNFAHIKSIFQFHPHILHHWI